MIHREIAERTGVSLGQVRKWLHAGEETVLATAMRARQASHDQDGCSLVRELPERPYAYLLGQYLGDGHIVRMRNGVYRLGITTCDDYPGVRTECVDAIHAVMPNNSIFFGHLQGATNVLCYSKHWPCLFPQHGRGRKHERPITLAPWQQQIALEEAPDDFVRGLIHSDGCRVINRVVVRGKRYEYARYFFCNYSAEIRRLFMDACGALGIDARHSNSVTVSVAKRYSVAVLDGIVGPKR